MKKTFAAFMAILLVFSLFGCTKSNEGPKATSTPAPATQAPAAEPEEFRVGMECNYAPFN